MGHLSTAWRKLQRSALIIVALAAICQPAAAQSPPSQSNYRVSLGPGAQGVVLMGLDALFTAWPCSAPNVVWNACPANGSGGTASTVNQGTPNVGGASAWPVSLASLPALSAGANVIGGVTQSGTWQFSLSSALPAGGNALGSVSVSASALPAGAATASNQASIITNQGTSGTGITQPTGGSGMLGWLSGIYNRLGSALTVTWSGMTVGVTALPSIPAGANLIGSVTASPTAVTCTSRSGTITVGGTAQNAAASNASRKTWTLKNPGAATETLYFDVTTTATTASLDLAPGAAFTWPADTVNTTAISVLGATTGHAFAMVECQ
jgi:hypothetical protein